MTDREPRTVRIDPEVWSRFVNWIVDKEGQKRHHVGRHVENALKEYIDHGREARIEEKVDEALALLQNADGTQTVSSDPDAVRDTVTETDDGAPDEPPHANARRQAKVDWLADEYGDWATVDRDEIRQTVDETYAYADEDRAEALVEAVLTRLKLLPDPRNDAAEVYVTEEKYDSIMRRYDADASGEANADD